MARHLSEKYPSQSRAAKPAGKPQRNRAPASARAGPAKINRQLSQDGDTGYQAVIEELPLPAGYTGPTMTTSTSMIRSKSIGDIKRRQLGSHDHKRALRFPFPWRTRSNTPGTVGGANYY